MVKNLLLTETNEQIESAWKEQYNGCGPKSTNCIVTDLATGKVITRKSNKITISGSIFTACKHFGIEPVVKLPNYNTSLGLDKKDDTPSTNAKKVILFGCAVDGGGAESDQIIEPDYESTTPADSLIPFRYPSVLSDLTAAERKIYFGRKTGASNHSYYFKKFDKNPVMYVQRVDGTPIDSNLYSSSSSTDAEVVMELSLIVTEKDFREYYKATTGLNTAFINSIVIFTAWEKIVDGNVYYQDIQQLSKLNISKEKLDDPTKGIAITYQYNY